MPRKKIEPQNSESATVPKRARKSSPERESASPLSEILRPRIMSAAEKRELILAHAASRQPVDSVQRFSLWTGVAICILVIGVGWVYTLRQSILGALATNASDNNSGQSIDYVDLRESMQSGVKSAIDKIDSLQEIELQALREQAVLIKTLDVATEEVASTSADLSPDETREDLFQPDTNQVETNTDPNQFRLPEGIIIESNN